MEGLTDAWNKFCRGSSGVLCLEDTPFDEEALDFLNVLRNQQQRVPLTCVWFRRCWFVKKAATKEFLFSICRELRVVHVHCLNDVADTAVLLEVASQACPYLEVLDLDCVDLRGAQVATLLQDLFHKPRPLQLLQLCTCHVDDQAWHEGVIRGIATREAEGGLPCLRIFDCQVDDARMQALAEAFCGSRSSSAALQNLDMGSFAEAGCPSALPAFVRLLFHCQNLQALHLCGSRIFGSAAAIATANALTHDQCPVYESFLEAVQQHPSLQTLSVSGCSINKFMAAPLFGVLEHNTTLRSLNVRFQNLGSDTLAQSVPHWKGLSSLTLTLDTEESPALQQALMRNVSLTSIQGGLGRQAYVHRICHRNRWLQRVLKLLQNTNNNKALHLDTGRSRRRGWIQASYWPFLVERLMQKVGSDISVLHTFVLVTAQELFV